ncbi:hypothetical protein NP233_g588 [Leucocoprinus birnbaumii]|uniref:Uncharacterized protein n=1 Tax=Leucocoprinus birnbaumii TaxID=56174 RepID=A0AAD5Z057_9AGAR|nr:hypothetical protein NP233_g588 [Leucocoprinus birnbaumii]
MEVERLRGVLTDLSNNIFTLQRQIDEANVLLETVPLSRSVPPTPTSRSASAASSRVSELERRVDELEIINRNLNGNLDDVLARHSMCEAQINHSIRARDGMMKNYKILVKIAANLLQNAMEGFPDGGYDEERFNALIEDLRRRIRSPSASNSSSSGTVRPRRHSPRLLETPIRSPMNSPKTQGERSSLTAESEYISDEPSQISTQSEVLVGPEGGVLTWAIHWGSKSPASIKVVAGPFVDGDITRIGIDNVELDGLFRGLFDSTDHSIRLAISPSPPLGLPDVKTVFLHDPFYLESESGTYIFDWVTPTGNQRIVEWLRGSGQGDEASVFHTFTFSKKKSRWFYFGAVRWALAWNNIWPTLESGLRTSILQHLSDRSNGTVTPTDIEEQMRSGQLQELSIEITQVNERAVMEEIAARLGKRPRPVKYKRSLPARREQ